MCICQFQSPNLSLASSTFPLGNHKFVFYICDYFCFVNKFVCTILIKKFKKKPKSLPGPTGPSMGLSLPLFFLTLYPLSSPSFVLMQWSIYCFPFHSRHTLTSELRSSLWLEHIYPRELCGPLLQLLQVFAHRSPSW